MNETNNNIGWFIMYFMWAYCENMSESNHVLHDLPKVAPERFFLLNLNIFLSTLNQKLKNEMFCRFYVK